MKKISAILFVLILLLAPLHANAQEELLKNGGFEDVGADGIPTHWYWDAWLAGAENCDLSIDNSLAHLGTNSAYINAIMPNDVRYVQDVTVTPNTWYKLSGYINAKDVDTQTTGAHLTVLDIFDGTRKVFDTQGNWLYVEVYGKTGPAQTLISVCVRIGSYGSLNNGTAWFDDISLVQENPPETGDASRIDFFRESNNSSGGGGNAQSGEPNRAESANKPLAYWLTTICAVLFVGVFWMYHRRGFTAGNLLTGKDGRMVFFTLIGLLFVLRLVIAFVLEGFHVDVNCFKAWSHRMAAVGPINFYTDPTYFCDYPPGYMLVLWVVGIIRSVLGLDYNSAVFTALVKLPGILADFFTVVVICKLANKKWGNSVAMVLALLYAANVAAIADSAYWGQIDSLLALLLILSFNAMLTKKHFLSGVLIALAVLCKPQGLLFLPVLLLGYLIPLAQKQNIKQSLLNLCIAVSGGLAASLVVILPFAIKMRPSWIFELYLGTLGSYEYASLNGLNLYTLFGGNWVSQYNTFWIWDYQTWGYIGIGLTLAATAFWAFKQRKQENIFALAAFFVTSFYILAPRMHERYLFPAILLLLFAFIQSHDKRFLYVFGVLSISQLYNMVIVLQVTHVPADDPILVIFSAVNVIAFGYLCYLMYYYTKHATLAVESKYYVVETYAQAKPPIGSAPEILPTSAGAAKPNRWQQSLYAGREGKRVRWNKLDSIWMLAITVVYGVVALINLGQTYNPETYWRPSVRNETYVADMGKDTTIARVAMYAGIGEGNVRLSVSDNGEDWTILSSLFQNERREWEVGSAIEHKMGEMYKWRFIDIGLATKDEAGANVILPQSGRYLEIAVVTPGIMLNELVLYDDLGNRLPVFEYTLTSERSSPNAVLSRAFDEQEMAPEIPSFFNSMYFDEVYHARTALEHLNSWSVYETTHPPLGKIFISAGIALFGMNPFGWRIVGTVFGIFMVPVMYLFAHELFKSTKWSVVATTLFAFDFMHFVQTRISTIDVYGVFFIMLMYYFMYKYYQMNLHHDKLWKTFIPLGLSGLCFGLGAASKWICFYAGGGLAVIFFYTVFRRFMEYRWAVKELSNPFEKDQPLLRKITNTFYKKLFITLLFCIVTFIVIPAVIYYLSYIPYFRVPSSNKPFDIFWNNQLSMFNYHSSLTERHPYEAAWYLWPLNIRPTWLYAGGNLPQGMTAGISTFGNPFVWWMCFVGTLGTIFLKISGKEHNRRLSYFLLLGLGAQFLPWVLITRATFAYHYFASVPFIILLTVYWFRYLVDEAPITRESLIKSRSARMVWVYGYVIACVLLFAMFYPLLSGATIPIWYAKLCKWLPTWVLFPM